MPDPRLVAWAEGVFAAESARSRGGSHPVATEQMPVQAPFVPEPRTETLPQQHDAAPLAPYYDRGVLTVPPPPLTPGGA